MGKLLKKSQSSYRWPTERRLMESEFFNPDTCQYAKECNKRMEEEYSGVGINQPPPLKSDERAKRMQKSQNCRITPPIWTAGSFVPPRHKVMTLWTRIRVPPIPERVNAPPPPKEAGRPRCFSKTYDLLGARGIQRLRKPLPSKASLVDIDDQFTRRLAEYPRFQQFYVESLQRNWLFYQNSYKGLMEAMFTVGAESVPEGVLKPVEDPRITRLRFLKEKKILDDVYVTEISDEICDYPTSALWDDLFDPITWVDIPKDLQHLPDIRTVPPRQEPEPYVSPDTSRTSMYEV